MLRVEGLSVAYGDFQVLWDVSLEVRAGEIVALLGPNGAGKSTLLNSVSGLVAPRQGRIEFDGRPVERLPAHQRVGLGLAHVLERRRLFPYLTVRQNLFLGAYHPGRAGDIARRAWPGWRRCSRRSASARASWLTRSPGASSRWWPSDAGLMARPRFLLVDEPTLGLAPRVVAEILDVLRRINRAEGITVLFIEQNVDLALSVASRGYILESGRVLLEGTADALRASPEVRRVFLGL